MLKVYCPVCTSTAVHTEASFKHNFKSINYLRCGMCTSIFLKSKVPNYANDYYNRSKAGFLRTVEKAYVRLSNLYKKAIINRLVDKKPSVKMIDIGSGRGEFLSIFGPNYIKEGLELKNVQNKKAISGIKMHYGKIADLDLKYKEYDVITLWHVVEHLSRPVADLGKLKKFLKDDGFLVVSTPNTNSLGYKIAKNEWYHFDYPYHLVLYNDISLDFLANVSGFRILAYQKHPFEFPLDFFWSIVRSRRRFFLLLFYPLIKIIYKETIIAVFTKK